MGFLTKPAIQAYFDPTFGASGLTAFIDRNNDRLVGVSNFTHQLTLFNRLSGVAITAQDTTAISVFIGTEWTAVIASPDGMLWCPNDTPPTLELCRIDPTQTPWKILQQWGSGGVPFGFPYPYSMAWLQTGNAGWLVTGNHFGGKIDVLQGTTGSIGFWGHDFAASTAENIPVCIGPQGPSSATAYWCGGQPGGPDPKLGKTTIGVGGALYDPGTWPTANPSITSTIIKTYVPTDFDPAWSAIDFFAGPAYDQTDGNVIVQVVGSGGGNPLYIAKLSVSDGSVLWTVAVPGSGGGFGEGIQSSRIANGFFMYYAQGSTFAGTLYLIDTRYGTFTTMAVTGLQGIQYQVSDDVYGCIIGNAAWDSGEGNLLLLNSTPPSNGSVLSCVYFISVEEPAPVSLSAISYTRTWGRW